MDTTSIDHRHGTLVLDFCGQTGLTICCILRVVTVNLFYQRGYLGEPRLDIIRRDARNLCRVNSAIRFIRPGQLVVLDIRDRIEANPIP